MREKEKVTRLIYVRHGETDFPLDRIYCDSQEDPPLNPAGIVQADAAARLLADKEIDAIYCSPSQRTRMTAGLVAAKHDLEVTPLEGLRERNFGIWEGLYFSEIEERYPDEYLQWKTNQAAFSPEGGESVFDMLERARFEVDGVMARHSGGVVVVVAHVGPIRALLCDAVNMPVEEYRRLIIGYASVSCVDYGQRQNNVVCMNLLGF